LTGNLYRSLIIHLAIKNHEMSPLQTASFSDKFRNLRTLRLHSMSILFE
jgi:hypothetical protein